MAVQQVVVVEGRRAVCPVCAVFVLQYKNSGAAVGGLSVTLNSSACRERKEGRVLCRVRSVDSVAAKGGPSVAKYPAGKVWPRCKLSGLAVKRRLRASGRVVLCSVADNDNSAVSIL